MFSSNHTFQAKNLQKFFREERLCFLDLKKGNDHQVALEGHQLEKETIADDLKQIGIDTRKVVQSLDLGIGGSVSVTEKITEKSETLDHLLDDIRGYNDALAGNELSLDAYEDPLGFQLAGGKTSQDKVKIYRGMDLEGVGNPYTPYNTMLDSQYKGLVQIRDSLQKQPGAQQKILGLIQNSQGELEDKRIEINTFLLAERERVLRQLMDYFLSKIGKINVFKKELESLAVDQSVLADFWQEIDAKIDLAQVQSKVEAGLNNVDDFQVIEAFDKEIEFQSQKIQERIADFQVVHALEKNPEQKVKQIEKTKERLMLLQKTFRKLRGVEKFGDVLNFLDDAEKRLQTNLNLGTNELIFLDESLQYFQEKFGGEAGISSQNILDQYAALEFSYANKLLGEVVNDFQNGFTETEKLLEDNDLILPIGKSVLMELRLRLKTLGERSKSSQALKKFAMGIGRLDKNGKVTGNESEVMKKWLLSCLQEQKNLMELIQKTQNPPLVEVIKELQNPQKNPLEVVAYLEKRGNLKKVPTAEFAEKYKDTGITNSYFVIEQNEYQGDVANYQSQTNDWKIYLDEGFFEKIKSGKVTENEKLRFKARIAHELAHREFEESKKAELEKQIDYTGEAWLKLKNQFQKLLAHKKNVQVGEIKTYSDVDVLNETWAFYRENQVAPMQGEFADLIGQFENLIGVRKTKVFGAEEGTDDGGMESLMSGTSLDTSSSTTVDEKLEEEKKTFTESLAKFENYIRLFGGNLPGEELSNKEKEKRRIVDISAYPTYVDFFNQSLEFYPYFKNNALNLDDKNKNQVTALNSGIHDIIDSFQKIEESLGEGDVVSGSYFKQLWGNTRFLACDDIYQMVTESWEFIQRRRDKRSADSRATVGLTVFGSTMLGNEYFTKQQKLEMDEVATYQDNLKNMSHEQMYPLLFAPKNKDHLKAVINELTSRGRMRWDDARVWDSLYRYTFSRISDEGRAENDILYRNEQLKKLIAGMWDENTWDGWMKDNTGGLNTALQNLHQEAQDIHAGGGTPVRKKLDHFIEAYKEKAEHFGKEDDPDFAVPSHRYQKLLDYAFEAGKMSMEDKFYYLIAGVRYRIIPIEYLKKIQSERFGLLPLLDFFYAKRNTYDEVLDLYNEIVANGGGEDVDSCKKGVHKLLMHKVLHDSMTKKRVQKIVSRDGVRNVDHDDWHTIMSVVSANDIDSLLAKPSGGKSVITKASMINGMAAFSSFAKAQKTLIDQQGSKYNYQDLVDSIDSFVAYDSRLMGRVGRKGSYERLGKSDLAEVPFASGIKVKDYQQSMYDFIRLIFEKYEGQKGKEYADSIFPDTTDITPEELEKQKKEGMEENVNRFTSKINDLLNTQKGKEALKSALDEFGGSMAGYQGYDFDYSINYKK